MSVTQAPVGIGKFKDNKVFTTCCACTETLMGTKNVTFPARQSLLNKTIEYSAAYHVLYLKPVKPSYRSQSI